MRPGRTPHLQKPGSSVALEGLCHTTCNETATGAHFLWPYFRFSARKKLAQELYLPGHTPPHHSKQSFEVLGQF